MMRVRFLRWIALLALHPVQACGREWIVDRDKSHLGFQGTMAGAAFEGRFSRWNAVISFDPENAGAGHAEVVIDMTSAATGDRQKDEALPQSDWFDAKMFPRATFKVHSFEPKSGSSYNAIGSLTIRNITKALTVPMTIELAGANLHAKGQVNLARTDYGVGQGSWSDGQWVDLKVVVVFDVVARQRE